jgi:signal transduction histidine kinase
MDPPFTRRFTTRYLLALAAVAVLTIAGTIVVELALAGHRDDARLINIAGRQRALSQRIAKAALSLRLADEPREAQRWRAELRGSLAEFQGSHHAIVHGDLELGISPDYGEEARARLDALEFDFQALGAATSELLARSELERGPALAAPVEALLRHEGPFFARMDELVGLLEAEAGEHVDALRNLSYLLLAGVLVALALQGVFVFRPAVARLSLEMRAQSRLQRRLLDAITAEQQRFGSDLHDGLLQQLTGLSLLIRSQLTRASRGTPVETKDLGQIGGLLDEAIAEARRMSRAMMPVVLEQKGIAYALEDLIKQAGAAGRARCTSRIALRGRIPDPSKANHLFRIAQEAVQNALKHAKAENITLELVDDGKGLELKVEDDGVGVFLPSGASRSGMGLRTMEYRARAIGAELRIEPGRPRGTIVRCRLADLQLWEASSDPGDSDVRPL